MGRRSIMWVADRRPTLDLFRHNRKEPPMTTLIAPDGREYRTSDKLEERRLVTGHRYTVKPDFDPAEHTVEEVAAYVKQHPEETDRIVEAEKTGQARKTIVGEN